MSTLSAAAASQQHHADTDPAGSPGAAGGGAGRHDFPPQASAVIDLAAIAHNTRVLKERAGNAELMVVVKADGYGHGAVQVATAALGSGATELGVATIAEAVQLREAGITAPVLCWLHSPDADFGAALSREVDVAVSSPRHLQGVLAAARARNLEAQVAVKVDTGLNRNGVSRYEWSELLDGLLHAQAEGAITVSSLFSHLARADEPNHPVIDLQAQRFREFAEDARAKGLRVGKLHLANSAATMTRPDLAFDMVRPGIALYGLSPVPELGQMDLVPAMSFQARVALVKKVAAGEGVSYGHVWSAPEDTVVAILPVGYADGVPRALTGKFEVLIGRRRYLGVGRVCMDQLVIDLGPGGDAHVQEGDTAVFFGPGSEGEPLAQAWADALGTIHYEVVTGIKGRAERTYINDQGAVG